MPTEAAEKVLLKEHCRKHKNRKCRIIENNSENQHYFLKKSQKRRKIESNPHCFSPFSLIILFRFVKKIAIAPCIRMA